MTAGRSGAKQAHGPLLLAAALLAATAATDGAYALSDQRDFDDMFTALNELMQFAAPGRSVNWQSEVTGNKGKITTLEIVDRAGRKCWKYDRTFPDFGAVKVVQGTACEKFPGLWEIVDEGPEKLVGGKPATKPQAAAPAKSPATTQTAARPKQPAYDRFTVRETQKLLTNLGYSPGPIDGAFGSKTRRAIERFERDRSYPVTGEPSTALIARLREADSATAVQSPPAQAEPASEAATAATTPGAEPLEAPVMLEAAPPVPNLEPPPGPVPSASGGAASDSSTVSGLPPPPPPPPSD